MRCFLIIIVLFFASCSEAGNKISLRQNEKDHTDKVAEFAIDDDQMNKAIDSARRNFPAFLEQLKNPCDHCEGYSVKLRFDFDEESGEHIWLSDLFFKKDQLFGLIDNVPESVNDLQLGDTVKINEHNLSDWMYIRNNQLIGGYTIKTIYRNSSGADKRSMEDELGAKIE